MQTDAATTVGSLVLFMVSGCGPVLTHEQLDYLKQVKPDERYPISFILDAFAVAREKSPALIHAAGRRWGAAIKAEFEQQGVKEVHGVFDGMCKLYHVHNHNAGTLSYKKLGEQAAMFCNNTPFPNEIIEGGASAVATAFGMADVTVEPMGDEKSFKLTWELD